MIRNYLLIRPVLRGDSDTVQVTDSQAVIRVRDHGPGVPESMLSEIFLPFRRFANGDGAGLGLAIAERAVSVHQGTIHAINAAGGGLIIEIGLPHKSVQGSRHD